MLSLYLPERCQIRNRTIQLRATSLKTRMRGLRCLFGRNSHISPENKDKLPAVFVRILNTARQRWLASAPYFDRQMAPRCPRLRTVLLARAVCRRTNKVIPVATSTTTIAMPFRTSELNCKWRFTGLHFLS
jgi:hypothetical protein